MKPVQAVPDVFWLEGVSAGSAGCRVTLGGAPIGVTRTAPA